MVVVVYEEGRRKEERERTSRRTITQQSGDAHVIGGTNLVSHQSGSINQKFIGKFMSRTRSMNVAKNGGKALSWEGLNNMLKKAKETM